MKRLFLLFTLAAFGSCQQNDPEPCYVCNVFTTQQGQQSREFCDKAEMDRFVAESRNDPKISLVECRNK